jgi:hypothetical protein
MKRFLLLIIILMLFVTPCFAIELSPFAKTGIQNADGSQVEFPDLEASGAVPVSTMDNGEVSAGNSSIIPLGIGGMFTGTAVEILNYSAITLLVESDADSAVNGLLAEFSIDGIDWHPGEAYTIKANTTKWFTPPVQSRYYRVQYTNGAVEQTEFHLHSVLKKNPIKWSSHNLTDNLDDGDDAELGVSVLKLRTAQDNYVTGSATSAGNFKISLEEFETGFNDTPLPVTDMMLFIARGLRTGMSSVNKYGRAEDGIQVTVTDIWDRADAAATQQIWLAPTAARIHTIVSSAAADDGTPEGAGAGAQSVRVWYLPDWDTKEAFEDVILNGVAGVAMNNAAVIIHRMKVYPVGTTYAINAGVLTATAAVDATITAQVNIGEGQTQMAIYGLPSIQTAYMTGYFVNAHNTGNPSTVMETDFTMLVNEHPDLNTLAFISKSNVGVIVTGSTMAPRSHKPYKPIPGPAIIKFQAETTLADTEGVTEFGLILVDN